MDKGFQILRKHIFVFFCLVLVTAMFGSKFMMSLGMIALIALSLIDLDLYPFRLNLSWEFFKAWQRLYKHKAFWAMSWIFWLSVLSYFWSSDVGEWYTRNRMHIPFLALSLAFLGMREWTLRYYNIVLKYMIFLAIASSGLVLYYYFTSDTNLIKIQRGQSIWLPINHIRYSLLIAYATVLSFYFGIKYYGQRALPILWFSIGTFLFIFLHIIAVRSGIIALYITLIIWLFITLIKHKKKGLSLLLIISICFAPFLAYQFVPTFKKKVKYMKWDLRQFNKDANTSSSDTRRLKSIIGGWEVFKSSPIIGVGIGDLKHEMGLYYKSKGEDFVYFPHNQYLFVLASIGVIGLVLFLFFMIFPIFYHQAYTFIPLLSIQIIALVSFFVENTIENAIGVAICSFFIIMGLRSYEKMT